MNYKAKFGWIFIFLFVSILLPERSVHGQTHYYWSTNLNEESSMLAGAVVGGGADIGSIYYNPSLISSDRKALFSFNASLFSWEFNNIHNALGDGIDIKNSHFRVQPRFISFLFKLKNLPDITFEAAGFSKVESKVDFSEAVNFKKDIILSLPGEERYFANFKYNNHYSEIWIGMGASYSISEQFSIGLSMFGTIKTLKYHFLADIYAGPQEDTISTGSGEIPYYSAATTKYEYTTYNNYRLIWKIGAAYKIAKFSLGLNITTPSINIYSDNKSVSGSSNQSNISNPDGTGMLPNYDIADEQIKKEIEVNSKDPFSIALGIKYEDEEKMNVYYSTVEFFTGIDPYKIITAEVNTDITTGNIFDMIPNKDWLSYASGANGVINIAIAYKRKLNENFLLLGGIKTDFDNKMDMDYKNLRDYKTIYAVKYNLYHLTGGVLGTYRGNRFFAGLQYSLGVNQNSTQIVNFSDPVEYNSEENMALVGTRQKNMDIIYNGISLFFGATFSFGKTSDSKD